MPTQIATLPKNKGGAPRKYTTQTIVDKCNEYFKACKSNFEQIVDDKGNVKDVIKPIPPTILGLCCHLDIWRETLQLWEAQTNDIRLSNTIKKAKQVIETYAEIQLFVNPRTAGVIFNLCNNFKHNWKQPTAKTEIEITVSPTKPLDALTDDELEQVVQARRLLELTDSNQQNG